MTAPFLRANCARCAALCCVALTFDRSALFGFDKPAGEPCRHLAPCGGCQIHAERDSLGFAGCVRYDCFGAGQYVTQEIFGGRSWRNDATLLRPMLAAFAAMRDVHELLTMLQEARKLALPERERRAIAESIDALQPVGGWKFDDVATLRIAMVARGVRQFLSSLRTVDPVRERRRSA